MITAIDDTPIRSSEDLTEVLAGLDPGDVIDVTVVSAQGERTVEIGLSQRPPDDLFES